MNEGLLFSGGLDSSILAAFNPKITAITVNLESSGEDIHYSKSLTRHLNIKHLCREVAIEEAIEAIPKVIKILKTFDPAIPNDLVVYFGLKLAKKLGISEVTTGDGSDELFAGYSFMREIGNLKDYIHHISQNMKFSSNELGEFFNIRIKQPFMDKKIINMALDIPAGLKIREENGRVWGKWLLRKSFEGMLPKEILWQDKRPLEVGSGMNGLRRIVSGKISDEEFRERPASIKFMNKEHFYYYKIYRNIIGEIPGPIGEEKECPGCGAGINPLLFHCKVCGHVKKKEM
ncbi:MAG: hypothetical protein JSV93_01105 [Candidatus Omnitrophota bacterium]|nr:MAG: hypothetical protein JSV93_01105 [Candidatus Omnitrophota bacterium]